MSGKNKLLESENKILMTETESLREVSSFLLGHTLNVLLMVCMNQGPESAGREHRAEFRT